MKSFFVLLMSVLVFCAAGAEAQNWVDMSYVTQRASSGPRVLVDHGGSGLLFEARRGYDRPRLLSALIGKIFEDRVRERAYLPEAGWSFGAGEGPLLGFTYAAGMSTLVHTTYRYNVGAHAGSVLTTGSWYPSGNDYVRLGLSGEHLYGHEGKSFVFGPGLLLAGGDDMSTFYMRAWVTHSLSRPRSYLLVGIVTR